MERSIRPATCLFCFVSFAFVVFLTHAPYFGLPYFWDELGQFVPSALDIYRDGAFVPHSAVPNAHPPGVMAYLAAVWKIFGYSIVATRAAILFLASLTALFTFLLNHSLTSRPKIGWQAKAPAPHVSRVLSGNVGQTLSSAHSAVMAVFRQDPIRLFRGLTGAPALVPVLLLLLDPLFYTQSMMAQLDMPAMLFTVLALLLFLGDRHVAAALASTALVLAKETGALLPLILAGVLLFDRPRAKYAAYYLAPFAVLAVWFFVLLRTTGQLFGDAGFTHYNLGYALHPVRATLCLIRRVYYLGIDNFRWAGSLAIFLAWKRTRIFASREWRIAWLFLGAHVVLVSVLGGAELERYLLPVLPLLYIAMGAALWTLRPVWRNAGLVAIAAGLPIGLFVNPPYPFPFENNLAMVDFVELHRDAAQYLEASYPNKTIYTAWPLTGALRDPAFGYVTKKLATFETSDLGYSTLNRLSPKSVDVLVLYSRTWEPPWSVLHWPMIEGFLRHFYLYEPQMDAGQVRDRFGLVQVRRWTQRGQWIEIYSSTLH